MRPLSAIRALLPAFKRTREVLFEPLAWPRFLIVCFIATYNLPSIDIPGHITSRFEGTGYAYPLNSLTFSPVVKYSLISSGIFLVLTLTILALITVFRLPFILFDLVSGRRSALRISWQQNGDLAWQFFGFYFCLSIPAAILSAARNPLTHFLRDLGGSFLFASAVMIYIFGVLLITLVIADFLVPVLALGGITVMQAFGEIGQLMRQAPREFLAYIGIKAVMVTILSLVLTVTSILFIRILVHPAESFGIRLLQEHASNGIVYLSPVIIVAAIAVLLIAFLFFAIYWCLAGPFAFFFAAYAIFFLADQYTPLRDLMYPDTKDSLPPPMRQFGNQGNEPPPFPMNPSQALLLKANVSAIIRLAKSLARDTLMPHP
jgi:hypothetical protein